MQEIKCILCESADTSPIDSINTPQLTKLYRTRAHVDVKRFFQQESIQLYHCENCDLKFFWPAITGDEKFYDELQDYPAYFMKNKAEYVEAAKYVAKSDRVLEIGCGEGMFRSFINCEVYHGLEFSDKAIAKAKLKDLHVLKKSIKEHSAVAREDYDVVCFFQVLEHVDDPKDFLFDALKCLRPGGKLIVAVPSEDSFIQDAANFYLNMPPHHISRWTDRALKKNAELFGLTIKSIIHEPLHPVHKSFYLKTKIFNRVIDLLALRKKLIDMGFAHSTVYALASMSSVIAGPFFKIKKIEGQSVLVIYSKP